MRFNHLAGFVLVAAMVATLTACPAAVPPAVPTASFTIGPETGDTETVFMFDAGASTTPANTTITEYRWDFGDGVTATGVTAYHRYTEPGTYTVTLTVVNDRALSDTESRAIVVIAPVTALAGRVTNATAGEAVAGSSVDIFRAGTDNRVANLTTNAEGAFAIELEPGHYDLRLSQAGFAGSQVLNARVVEGRTTRLHIVQMEAFNPAWPATPPGVTIGKVKDGNVYDGTQGVIPYDVSASPAAPLGTRFIYAALDRMPGAAFTTLFRHLFVQTDQTGARFIDPLAFAAQGETTFEVVVYDSNNNRTHALRHIEVNHYFAEAPLAAPELVMALSVTTSQQIRFLAVEPQAAPPGGNLFVDLHWFEFELDGAWSFGYNIYRSLDGGPFEKIATSPANFHRDISPELRPGRTACYRVTGFLGTAESEPSNVRCTTPLEPWDVRLVSPADDAQGVPLVPTFEWEPTARVGVHHYYIPMLWDFLTGTRGFLISPEEFALVDRTSYTWNEGGQYTGTPFATLHRGTTYEWQMLAAYATDHPTNPTAVSIAVDGFGLFAPPFWTGTQNFTFTTTP